MVGVHVELDDLAVAAPHPALAARAWTQLLAVEDDRHGRFEDLDRDRRDASRIAGRAGARLAGARAHAAGIVEHRRGEGLAVLALRPWIWMVQTAPEPSASTRSGMT